jgi:SET domain-containing protein
LGVKVTKKACHKGTALKNGNLSHQKINLAMILPNLFIAPTDQRGRGVFTDMDIDKGTIIEISPVIVMTKAERVLLDQTLLHDYIFEWGVDPKGCCMALGYIPLYNHSYRSNCEYEMDYDQQLITVRAARFIKSGEEIFINYNGDWNNETPVWFNARR